MKRDIAAVLQDKNLVREMARGLPGVDRAALLAGLFEEWGGMRKFAHDFVQEFHVAKPGSISRQRLLDCVCRLINSHSNDAHVKPVEEMSEEELLASIHAALPLLETWGTDGDTVTPSAPREAAASTLA
jgi:hypothetical protein